MSTARVRLTVVVITLLPLLAIPGIAQAAPDHTITLTEESKEESWQGAAATGLNQSYDRQSGEPCPEQPTGPEDYCEQTLLHVDTTFPPEVHVTMADDPVNDFDLYIYESDEDANRGPLVDWTANPQTLLEAAQIPNATGYYLIQVVYFQTIESGYEATAEIVAEGHAPFPPDVDDPAGLQEVLASDPAQGWTSRSEMHLAEDPTNPDLLVAGSKFYNKDRDALAEYEFKVGSYVSFDGGGSWVDLGQVATCPAAEAPPETWPDNTCYPADDPNRGGIGPEDVDDPDEPNDPFDDRGTGDFGEEYITSDPWVQFDDEGNAYFMVLDHPPFDENPDGNGWGMTLHKWKSVSAEDVAAGETWSDRIPINTYPESIQRDPLGFLDDKNTFAVNNAGEDGDGKTGIMIACWGQSIRLAVKQQIVCERSTDGGESWPGPPILISDVQHLVIGVHVVADTRDEQTFYATWLQYATGGAAGNIGGALTPETLEFAVTHDGGQTWVHRPVPVSLVTGIPRQFPGQRFRNLSIPIMAVGPESELYIVWADYVAASDASTDRDGMEADIKLVKSTNGGVTWSAPSTVNAVQEAPNVNADQFQPYVAVTESGQVNVLYFDRRLDPSNFFTDVFLSRSNDGGATFTEHRLTHDATNPEYNAPVSGSGLFFGDYQGLVANHCNAVAFVNDTHLANDELDPGPVRDPEFDQGLPHSPYQEAVSWRVPNTPDFGGTGNEACGDEPPPPPTCPGKASERGNHVVGTPGRDVLVGTPGKDVICGRGGNDVIKGKGGNDVLIGGAGKDTVKGGNGRDDAFGSRGKDTLRGGKGADELRGQKGNDFLGGGAGPDDLRGGPGTDTCRGGPGRDELKGCER